MRGEYLNRMFSSKTHYEPFNNQQYYIDKTEFLEKGMATFPSLYIEGAAASGKTTAVRMFLSRYPDMEYFVLWMDAEQKNPVAFYKKLEKLADRMEKQSLWVIFENMPKKMPPEMSARTAKFLMHLPEECHAILIGRECPELEFLKLIWKRKMELFPQELLLFEREEIRNFVEAVGSPLNPDEILKETGGWAGCVDMMLRMSVIQISGMHKKSYSAEELRKSYEITSYIKSEILETLTSEEQELMRRTAVCPWVNEELCADVWGIQWAEDCLNILGRKGILVHDMHLNRWKTAPLFQRVCSVSYNSFRFWIRLGQWYDSHGFVKEALQCLKLSGKEKEIYACMIRNYQKVPFSGISFDEVMKWKESTPEICYLREMYCYFHQNFEGLNREIIRLNKMDSDEKKKKEIILNLTYVKPDMPLEEWLNLLESYAQKAGIFSLYSMLGSSVTYLCGLRDLSELFACTRKEENRKAHLWRECLGENEYTGYCLARLDYYLEIQQKDAVRKEDWDVIREGKDQDFWQFRLARMYLLCKLQTMQPGEEIAEYIRHLRETLVCEENEWCVRNANVVNNLFFDRANKRERFSVWLLHSGDKFRQDLNEDNYLLFFCLAKGFMLINQYEKAERIHRKLIPYLQFYRRSYLLAEILFQQAIVYWERRESSQALRSAIESFMINGEYRYVRMYTEYGNQGQEVLEAYIEWLRNSRPEGWHRKKKYNYGNVLRMPLEDYMETVLRLAKREAKYVSSLQDHSVEEKLTMMETVILQDLALGASNAEICKELNLKLPTVKSHIYSLYKKLDVKNRVQAVLKGEELGILK